MYINFFLVKIDLFNEVNQLTNVFRNITLIRWSSKIFTGVKGSKVFYSEKLQKALIKGYSDKIQGFQLCISLFLPSKPTTLLLLFVHLRNAFIQPGKKYFRMSPF
jgi:hypothetical protein